MIVVIMCYGCGKQEYPLSKPKRHCKSLVYALHKVVIDLYKRCIHVTL